MTYLRYTGIGLAVITSIVIARPAAGQLSGPIITRFAGTGIAASGPDGGPAAETPMGQPGALAFDNAGNLYIADTSSCVLRRVSAGTGTFTTVPGAGSCVVAGMVVDQAGNIYYSENINNRIQKVSVGTGAVTTFAGGSGPGLGDDGPATAAHFSLPSGLALGANGDLYVADLANGRVRRISALTGVITTVAGSETRGYGGDGGPATSAKLRSPSAVAIDSSGNLYIADRDNCHVRKVNPAGIITTVPGTTTCQTSPQDGIISVPPPGGPTGVAVDAGGNVYFVQSSGHLVTRASAVTNMATVVAGSTVGFSGDGGPATSAQLRFPRGILLDRAENLYIADGQNNVVRRVTGTSTPLTGDIDGDGASDLVSWSSISGNWSWQTSSGGHRYASGAARQWGAPSTGDRPLLGDIDGDGSADLIVWRATTGTWHWLLSSHDYDYAAAGAKQWGNPALGDTPFLADIDGDSRSDLVVWRASTGTWYWLTSSTDYNYGWGDSRQWGNQTAGDVPLIGDVDGDGRSDLAVWRASTGTWFAVTAATGFNPAFVRGSQWGSQAMGDVPMLQDMDGDRRADFVVWRSSNGTFTWLASSASYDPAAAGAKQWGNPAWGDTPLLADLDGDARGDLRVWRAPTATWYWLTSSSGFSYALGRSQKQGPG